jgi:hypothetical protein
MSSSEEGVELKDVKKQKATKPAEIKKKPLNEKEGAEMAHKILNDLTATENGLTDDEVEERRAQFGYNSIPVKKRMCLV